MAFHQLERLKKGIRRLWPRRSGAADTIAFVDSKAYWRRRYARGRHSGPGSQNEVAAFKAETINGFVKAQCIATVTEFGCGDGQQLALYDLPNYVGLDVAPEAIQICRDKFRGDLSKSFFLYDPHAFVDNHGIFAAELTMSVEVIFHLTEDDVFDAYMRHLFESAKRFVIIFSSNDESIATDARHVKHRKFSDWVATYQPDWRHIDTIRNAYPYQPEDGSGSFSDFFIFKKDEVR